LNYSLKITSPPNLRERLVVRLRDAIARGHFAPGERLRERVLCELTGVSRTSLREALRELENEGLVTSIPNRGIIVSRIDPVLARATFEMRGALELLAVNLFMSRAGASELDALTAAFATLCRGYDSGESSEILDGKTAFYDAILDGAANPLLKTALKSIHVRVSQLRAASLAQPSRTAESLREFKTLYDAMKSGNVAAAQEACKVHIDNAGQAALAGLAARFAAGDEPELALVPPATAPAALFT
jgi:DNA-binding GntR family transcriptional regulator